MTPAEVIAAAMDDTYEDEYGSPHAGTFAECAEASIAALSAAGYAVVKLPSPNDDSEDGKWWAEDVAEITLDTAGDLWMKFLDPWLNPFRARGLAAALLAAAAAAEVEAGGSDV